MLKIDLSSRALFALCMVLTAMPVSAATNDVDHYTGRCIHGDDRLANCVAAAKLGSPDAAQMLAEAYRFGWHGAQKDQAQATYWLQVGAKLGVDNAQNALGLRYLCGLGIEKNVSQAMYWFKKASEFGKLAGLSLAGYYEQTGLTGEANPKAALDYYIKDIKSVAYDNKLISNYGLGVLFSEGAGVERDDKRAVEYFTMAYDQALGWSTVRAGFAGYYGGSTIPLENPSRETLKRQLEETQLKAESGDPKAEYQLGQIYDTGKGVQRDVSIADKWFERAADAGYGPAVYARGLYYMRSPQGSGRDYAKAEFLFRQNADVNPYAKFALAYLLAGNVQGNKTDAERAEGVSLMISAANDNNQDAQTFLAIWYALGVHVEKDLSISKKWWAKRMDCSHWQ